MEKTSFAVIGGDKRSFELARLLKEKGHLVNIFGFNKLEDEGPDQSLSSSINGVDIVIAPVPFNTDGRNINAPYNTEDIRIEGVFRNMTKRQKLIGGPISNELMNISTENDITTLDILKREEMAVLNAIPTAEGGIQIALEEMPTTLHNSNVMVLGFGRIGKILSKMLNGIGSNVYVVVRKYSDISWIQAYGYKPIFIEDLHKHILEMDLIFNTIPNVIINEEILQIINKETLIIDLASKPGGIDYAKAEEMNIKVIHALGLPGKVAPVSSAGFMMETIYNIIEELGV